MGENTHKGGLQQHAVHGILRHAGGHNIQKKSVSEISIFELPRLKTAGCAPVPWEGPPPPSRWLLVGEGVREVHGRSVGVGASCLVSSSEAIAREAIHDTEAGECAWLAGQAKAAQAEAAEREAFLAARERQIVTDRASAALTIQRCWRGMCGRREAAVRRAVRALEAAEAGARARLRTEERLAKDFFVPTTELLADVEGDQRSARAAVYEAETRTRMALAAAAATSRAAAAAAAQQRQEREAAALRAAPRGAFGRNGGAMQLQRQDARARELAEEMRRRDSLARQRERSLVLRPGSAKTLKALPRAAAPLNTTYPAPTAHRQGLRGLPPLAAEPWLALPPGPTTLSPQQRLALAPESLQSPQQHQLQQQRLQILWELEVMGGGGWAALPPLR